MEGFIQETYPKMQKPLLDFGRKIVMSCLLSCRECFERGMLSVLSRTVKTMFGEYVSKVVARGEVKELYLDIHKLVEAQIARKASQSKKKHPNEQHHLGSNA